MCVYVHAHRRFSVFMYTYTIFVDTYIRMYMHVNVVYVQSAHVCTDMHVNVCTYMPVNVCKYRWTDR
jgi:hypothetical protein